MAVGLEMMAARVMVIVGETVEVVAVAVTRRKERGRKWWGWLSGRGRWWGRW